MKITGGCNCGNVRYMLTGKARRIGLCHCGDCRKETGSAFSYFGVWPRENTELTGVTHSWHRKAGEQHFCPQCGSSVFCDEAGSDEIEIRLGTLDEPLSELRPEYELWVIRREHWMAPLLGNEQHERDRN